MISRYNENDMVMIEENGVTKPILCKITFDHAPNKPMLFPVLKPGTIMEIKSKCRRHNPDYGIISKKEKHQIDCTDELVLAPDPFEVSSEEFIKIYFIYGDEVDENFNSVDYKPDEE